MIDMMVVRFNRKGMSPLIATVLLIAFAVALGAMIMNWSADIETQQQVAPSTTTSPCDQVHISLNEVFGKKIFCYADGVIRFNIVNDGSTGINGLQVRTVDAQLKEVKQDIPDSAVAVGDTFQYELPFSKSGKIHVELVPKVVVNNEVSFCVDKKIVRDILPDCDSS